jgi:hypothetical protein
MTNEWKFLKFFDVLEKKYGYVQDFSIFSLTAGNNALISPRANHP